MTPTGERRPERARAEGTGLDLATLLGLAAALALLAAALALGGSASSFLDLPSALIVLGGTFAVTTISFSLGEVGRAQTMMLKAALRRLPDPTEAAQRMMELAERARRGGPLQLEPLVDRLAHTPFLHKAVRLVVDGVPGDEVERVLRRELAEMARRHRRSAGVFRRAAEVAPAMGLIGTLVGQVQMLSHLEDPGSLGPSMALALITTFYGAVLANVVFAPLAMKLERNSEEELLALQVYLVGAVSIGRQENPRRLEVSLNALLPPAKRIQYFD
jgi:chemotaxis protein MotA